MSRSLRISLVLALVAACDTESTQILTNGVLVEAAARSAAIHTEPSTAPASALVRAVDASGIAVGPGTIRVDVDGIISEVEVDPSGYGTVPLDAEVTSVGAQTAVVLPTATPLPDLPHVEAVRPEAIALVTGRRGYLANVGTQVWWTGPDLPDHPVLELGSPIRGLADAQIDGDGVVDAVAWGGDQVVLLRGRGAGGAGFGAAVAAPGWTALAAAVGDLDEDDDVDLAVAWDTGDGTVLQAWVGDGAWGFTPSDEIALLDAPSDLDISRARSDAAIVLTGLVPDSTWLRYRLTDGVWVGTGGQLQVDPPEGSRLLHADLDGNGRDELIVVPPRASGSVRRIQVWDLRSENASVLNLDLQGGWITTGDADGDTVTELWLLAEDGLLQVLGDEDGEYVRRDAGVLTAPGPIATTLLEGDTVPDLLVGVGTSWQRFVGRLDEEDGRWRPVRALVTRRELDLVAPVVPADAEPGVDEIVSVAALGEMLYARRLTLGGAGPVQRGDTFLRADLAEVVDLAACGADLWVLFPDELVHVDLAAATVVGRRALEGGAAVACQASGEVRAAVVTGSEVIPFGSGAAEGARSAGGGAGVAFAEEGAVACAGPCAGWPWPGGGVALAEAASDGVVVTWPGGDAVSLGAGQDLAVQDSDADGEHELWIRDDSGRIGVVRATAAGPVVEDWLWTSPRYAGAPWVLVDPDRGRAVWFEDDGALVWMP